MLKPTQTEGLIIGERLRKARSSAGFTQEAVADKLGIARTTIVAIERGNRMVRDDELRSLAALYQISLSRLLGKDTVHIDLVAKFRKDPGVSEIDNDAIETIRILNRLVAASLEIETLLGKLRKPMYPPEWMLSPGDIVLQAEDAATALRQRLGVGMGPIPDLISLLELELGIRVFVVPLPSKVSGAFVFDEIAGACMVINAKHARARRMCTAGHETGHFVVARSSVDVYIEGIPHPSKEDKFADAFSYALLMPAATIRSRFREIQANEGKFSSRQLILLAHWFGVSVELLCRRLERLKLLPVDTYNSLKDKGLSSVHVNAVLGDTDQQKDPVIAPRLAVLAVDAYERGFLSEGQLAEKLMIDRLEARRLIDMLGSGEHNDEIQLVG